VSPLIDDLLGGSVDRDGGRLTLTLAPGLQGLPDTAHGGSVLAVFDAVAEATGPRTIVGVYRRRVPVGVPLGLAMRRDGAAARFELIDGRATLVEGSVEGATGPAPEAARLALPAYPLPVSHTCFACGTRNEIGLHLALEFDEQAVAGAWVARDLFRTREGTVATVVLTTLLDEAAFWLGALATGEAGMTTEVRVRLLRSPAFGTRLRVSGLRARVRPLAGDPRYWQTETAIHDERGAPIATGRITFVAVRGAAKRLVAGLLAMNPAGVVRRVFPAYA
jgi:acyl-coenzyme A thioesterase PaaI-like protein